MEFQKKKICFVFLCGFPLLWGSDKPIHQFSFRACMLYLFSITVKEEMEAFCVNLGPIQSQNGFRGTLVSLAVGCDFFFLLEIWTAKQLLRASEIYQRRFA